MSYKIQVKNELYHIIFYNEPNFCRSLEMKPVSNLVVQYGYIIKMGYLRINGLVFVQN